MNSYQTRGYPATALMESVRDRQCGGAFSENTDWFSFAVVSFSLFVGIHPYKGSHPRYGNANHWQEHMARNLSVLNPQVSVPASCLPFGVIPKSYRDWYHAVLEEGKRLPPPGDLQPVVILAPPPRAQGASSLFQVEEIAVYPGEILACWEDIVLTTGGVFLGGAKIREAPGDARLGCTPRLRRPLAGWIEGGRVRLYDLASRAPIPLEMAAEQMMARDGTLYVKQGLELLRLEPVELPDRTLVGARPVGNVTARSTALYDGVVLQSLLGATHALLFPRPGACCQIRLTELDGHTVLDARASRNVLVAVACRAGRTHRFVFRFSEDARAYDCRVVSDVPSSDVNFAALDTGVCLLFGEGDDLELFACRMGAPEIKVLRDPALGADVRLFARGGQALFARGERLYRFRMSG